MHHTALRTAQSCQADLNSNILVLVFVFVLSSACVITGRRLDRDTACLLRNNRTHTVTAVGRTTSPGLILERSVP